MRESQRPTTYIPGRAEDSDPSSPVDSRGVVATTQPDGEDASDQEGPRARDRNRARVADARALNEGACARMVLGCAVGNPGGPENVGLGPIRHSLFFILFSLFFYSNLDFSFPFWISNSNLSFSSGLAHILIIPLENTRIYFVFYSISFSFSI
jgi:hypothetical protein